MRQNSVSKPKTAAEVMEKIKIDVEKDSAVNMDAINEEEFSSDDEEVQTPSQKEKGQDTAPMSH